MGLFLRQRPYQSLSTEAYLAQSKRQLNTHEAQSKLMGLTGSLKARLTKSLPHSARVSSALKSLLPVYSPALPCHLCLPDIHQSLYYHSKIACSSWAFHRFDFALPSITVLSNILGCLVPVSSIYISNMQPGRASKLRFLRLSTKGTSGICPCFKDTP